MALDGAAGPFGFASTTADVTRGVDLGGLRVVVTGGGGGLGRAAALALAAAGAQVTITVRALAPPPDPAIEVARLDLADLTSIRQFTGSWQGPLHVLVNNAGGILPELQRTPQGWEMQFAVNHLGHFALSQGLHAALAAGAAEVGEARVVTLSSSGHLASPVIFDDLHFRFRQYSDMLGYAQSKTANVLFGVEASRRWAADGICANAAMPGPTYTGFQRNMDPERLRERAAGADLAAGETPPGWKTLEQGAATTVFLAASPLVKGIGGRYFEDCAEAETVHDGNGYRRGVAPYALDPDNAARLWHLSQQMAELD
jgi:NAD(P)-dependent dehydrogenase (short-subunit alcohol dehydrogenase family)